MGNDLKKGSSGTGEHDKEGPAAQEKDPGSWACLVMEKETSGQFVDVF